jgi:hypothetical protein
MTFMGNRGYQSAGLRGHEYVTGRANPVMETGQGSRYGGLSAGGMMGALRDTAGEAVSVIAGAAEGALGGVVGFVRRHPTALVLFGIGIALTLLPAATRSR